MLLKSECCFFVYNLCCFLSVQFERQVWRFLWCSIYSCRNARGQTQPLSYLPDKAERILWPLHCTISSSSLRCLRPPRKPVWHQRRSPALTLLPLSPTQRGHVYTLPSPERARPCGWGGRTCKPLGGVPLLSISSSYFVFSPATPAESSALLWERASGWHSRTAPLTGTKPSWQGPRQGADPGWGGLCQRAHNALWPSVQQPQPPFSIPVPPP